VRAVPAALRVCLVTLVAASAPPARAQTSATPPTVAPSIERPLVLAPGQCQATLVIESNESARRRFEPLSLAPDLHCGIWPRVVLGVTHSARSLSRVDSGGGLCLSGEDGGCASLYDSTALDALAHLRGGAAAVAARARLVAASYAPFKPSLRVGALARVRHGRVALLIDPHVVIGLANRDRGNRDQLNLPARGQLHIGSRVLLMFESGVRGELAVFGDAFAVPIGTGVEVSTAPAWDIGLEAAFPRLLGPQNSFKDRHVALYVAYRPGPGLFGWRPGDCTATGAPCD
jgi:hypothetical protein